MLREYADAEKPVATIEIERPTGPRLTLNPESLGQLTPYRPYSIPIPFTNRTIEFGWPTRKRLAAVSGIAAFSFVFHLFITMPSMLKNTFIAMPMLMMGVGGPATPTVAGYTGPGNIVASPNSWYGFRAFSSADRGNILMNVCNVADVVCADLSSDATTGALVISSIGGSSCSVVTCTIKTMYDRSGNGYNITQATIASRPTLVVSCVNSLPCANSNSQNWALSGGGTVNQPFTMNYVANRTSGAGEQDLMARYITDGALCGFNTANNAYLWAGGGGGFIYVSAPNNAWHAVQCVFNGASSAIDADGTTVTNASAGIGVARPSISFGGIIGNFVEGGLWPVAFSAGNITSMCHNQFVYWGTSTSC